VKEELPANPLDVRTDESDDYQDSSEGVDYTELQQGSLKIPAEAVLAKSQSTEDYTGVYGYLAGALLILVIVVGVILFIRKRSRWY